MPVLTHYYISWGKCIISLKHLTRNMNKYIHITKKEPTLMRDFKLLTRELLWANSVGPFLLEKCRDLFFNCLADSQIIHFSLSGSYTTCILYNTSINYRTVLQLACIKASNLASSAIMFFFISSFQGRWPAPEEVSFCQSIPCRCLLFRKRHLDVHKHIQQSLLAQSQTQLRHQLLHTL